MSSLAHRALAPLRRLRRSMTAQIALAITLVSVALVLATAVALERLVASELRRDNELLLISQLAFLRDDLVARVDDPAALASMVQRPEQRYAHVHAAVLDESGLVLARSAHFLVPAHALTQRVVDAARLPTDASVGDFAALRESVASLAPAVNDGTGRPVRVLVARVDGAKLQGHAPKTVLAAIAVDTSEARELLLRVTEWGVAAPIVALLLAAPLAFGLARGILARARDFGHAAARIGAGSLDERLSIDDAPLELVESRLAFNRMLDRLRESFERLSTFSSDIAHDLRTPLGNLLGEAQVTLSRPRSAEEYRLVIESAVDEYERLSRIIANMLFLAQVDNDRAARVMAWVDVGAAMDRVAGYFEVLAEERGVTLQRSLRAEAGRSCTWADDGMLVRAIGNLVANALRHAVPDSTVRLEASLAANGACTIAVANRGPAIPPQDWERVFDRFYRGDRARQGSSAGLGLAIVRSIMALHRGTAAIERSDGEETVFVLHFPGAPSERAQHRGPASLMPSRRGTAPRKGHAPSPD